MCNHKGYSIRGFGYGYGNRYPWYMVNFMNSALSVSHHLSSSPFEWVSQSLFFLPTSSNTGFVFFFVADQPSPPLPASTSIASPPQCAPLPFRAPEPYSLPFFFFFTIPPPPFFLTYHAS